MKIELDSNADVQRHIASYSAGSVVIGERHYNTSLIVSPERIVDDWGPEDFTDLAAHHLETVVSLQPEIVVIGTGRALHFPAADVLEPLLKREIGYEIMDTGAACRCYNILTTEGRRGGCGPADD
ncbi:MAG: Mth938-like domain-containing protein [Gammaproteobacteria bacterium]|nr:Mth938-like domain-containing protein [Gammaproteobacteria bacterium]